MRRFLEELYEAEKELMAVDHMIYVAFPLVKEKNILIRSLLKIKNITVTCINLILQYEYVHRNIELSSDPQDNFYLFKEGCSKKYAIPKEDIIEIERLFNLAKSHRKSPMEFIKDGKVVILSDNMLKTTFEIEDIKKFLELSKRIISKIKRVFERNR